MALFDWTKRKKKEPEERGLVEFTPLEQLPAQPGPHLFDVLPSEEAGLIQSPEVFQEIPPFEVLEPVSPPFPEPLRMEPELIREEQPFTPPPQQLRMPSGLPSKEWLDRVFDLQELWRRIRAGRRDPDFMRAVEATYGGGPQADLPLVLIADREEGAEEKVAQFLGIPLGDLEAVRRSGRDPWRSLLNPVLYDVERGLVWAMPDDIPGMTIFGLNDSGEFGLLYTEESPYI